MEKLARYTLLSDSEHNFYMYISDINKSISPPEGFVRSGKSFVGKVDDSTIENLRNDYTVIDIRKQ